MKVEEGASGNAANFCFSIRPKPEKKIIEGVGELGDITIIMGRPGSGKSLFLRYLFSLITRDKELAQFVSSEILEPGSRVVLKTDSNALECSKPEKEDETTATCYIDVAGNKKAYLFMRDGSLRQCTGNYCVFKRLPML
jgi:energy-coupling factor transporter ATP-binding protein EcfA2